MQIISLDTSGKMLFNEYIQRVFLNPRFLTLAASEKMLFNEDIQRVLSTPRFLGRICANNPDLLRSQIADLRFITIIGKKNTRKIKKTNLKKN